MAFGVEPPIICVPFVCLDCQQGTRVQKLQNHRCNEMVYQVSRRHFCPIRTTSLALQYFLPMIDGVDSYAEAKQRGNGGTARVVEWS